MTIEAARITGLDELIAKVNDPALLGDPLRRFIDNSLLAIKSNVIPMTKRSTGNLMARLGKDLIQIDPSPIPLWGTWNSSTQYGIFVEEDTRPHWPPKGALAGWAHRHGVSEYLVRRKIARYGTRGAHMFALGTEYSLPGIEANLENCANEIESEWVR